MALVPFRNYQGEFTKTPHSAYWKPVLGSSKTIVHLLCLLFSGGKRITVAFKNPPTWQPEQCSNNVREDGDCKHAESSISLWGWLIGGNLNRRPWSVRELTEEYSLESHSMLSFTYCLYAVLYIRAERSSGGVANFTWSWNLPASWLCGGGPGRLRYFYRLDSR